MSHATTRRALGVFVVLCAVLVSLAASAAAQKNPDRGRGEDFKNRYIVVFKDSVGDSASTAGRLSTRHHFKVKDVYGEALKGFSVELTDTERADLTKENDVAFIAEDKVIDLADDATSSVASESSFTASASSQTQPTGVKRIGALASGSTGGSGVTVAVIDTGIDLSHPDLKANILNKGVDCFSTTSTAGGQDDNGHGTHVAGIIAAQNNSIGVVGVAPKAKLIPVKVIGPQGYGYVSTLICGVDWITANAKKYNIKVANMSLSGSGASDGHCGKVDNDPLHQAICRSRDAGITYVVAAGNNGVDASASIPSAYDDAVITVSALADSDGAPNGRGAVTPYGKDDTFASFSNYGSVVDVGAPGVNILSTWLGGGYGTLSGTSMATPHVAGAAALDLALHPKYTWSQVRSDLISLGERLGSGHTDPSGHHSEPVVKANKI